jgi:tetratricopeptide (TPR) repeat protein
MDRRLFLRLVGASLTEPAFEWLLAAPAGGVESSAGRRLRHEHVDSIEQMTAHLRRLDDQLGGGAVLDLVRQHVQYVVRLIKNHSYPASIGQRLHAAAGELLRLGGWLSFDAGQQANAQRYWLAALREAHAAGDRALGANVLGFMSCQAKDLELYDEAIKLAESARRGYLGGSPQVAAILNLRAAEAHAQTLDISACRAAIDAGYEAFRTPPPETGNPGWSYWLDEAQVNEQIGYCYVRLEDWTAARTHLRTAIRLQTDEQGREGALRRALLALTYARQGEPERACEIATIAVAALSGDVDSDRCVGHIRRVQHALQPYRKLGVVADFNERTSVMLGAA